MEKSVDAFRTISEVAEDLKLPQHVLRFWETRFAQIRPLKRAGGRRYYRPADIVLLRTIRQLLYDEGYTIKGVQRLLKDKGAKALPGEIGAPDELVASDDRFEMAGAERTGPEAGLHQASDVGFVDDGEADAEPQLIVLEGAALREALMLVDECERILRALRLPSH